MLDDVSTMLDLVPTTLDGVPTVLNVENSPSCPENMANASFSSI
jgi:hypothetical protein